MTHPIFNPVAQQAELIEAPNRGTENRTSSSEPQPTEISLLSVDSTIIDYLENTIKPSITDDGRLVPVPIIYTHQERWVAIRKDGMLRDPKNGKAQAPVIAIRRTNIKRGRLTNPSNKYLYITAETAWNSRNAYDKYAVQNGIKPSRRLRHIMIPDYVDLTYEIILWTEKQEQMNELIEQINVENDEFWGLRNQYKFRVRILDYSDNSQLPAATDRLVRTTFNMEVSAYLVPDKIVKNFQHSSTNTTSFTSKKTVIFQEIDGS